MQLFFTTMAQKIIVYLCVLITLVGGACGPKGDTGSITVFAAASLQEPLRDIADKYESENGLEIYLNLGGSMSLANQISRGAPADVFIAAGTLPAAKLLAETTLQPQDVSSWLTNELLMVTGKPNRFIGRGIEIVLDNTVAIADPALAPAGSYARECIDSFGMWEQIEYSVIRSPNVRAALASVEAGSADLAFIYETDLQLSGKVEKVFRCPEGSHSPIEYLVSLVSNGSPADHGAGFISFLNSEYAIDVMSKHGFTVIGRSE